MLMNSKDEVVETRCWRSGVEIISRVNWSQVGRVRVALGLLGDELSRAQFSHPIQRQPLTLHGGKSLPSAKARAA
jgi:hypothetical protein